MSIGRGQGRGRRRRDPATVDLTPLIDVTFQLLIFFLLTATFRDFSSLDVDLAQAKNTQKATDQKAVVVSIDAEGRIEVDQVEVDPGELETRLCKSFQEGQQTVHIRADKSSTHDHLVSTMDVAKRCGYTKLGILHAN